MRRVHLHVGAKVTIALLVVTVTGVIVGYAAVQMALLPETVARSQLTRVPDVSGMELDDAAQAGEDEGYSVIVGAHEHNADVGAGQVVYQVPSPGTYHPRGDSIWVLMSLGPGQVVLPDMAGIEPDLAESILLQLGLESSSPRTESSDLYPQGVVIGTIPPAGTTVESQQVVTLVLSRGGAMVAMPNVGGLELGAARDTLEVHGLTVGEISSIDAGRAPGAARTVVVDQEPAAGQRIREGSAVRLFLGDAIGPAPQEE